DRPGPGGLPDGHRRRGCAHQFTTAGPAHLVGPETMSAAEIVLIALALLALVAVALGSVAQRLDRLHRREYQTRATLEAQLVRRADAAADLAASGALDPAGAVLVADAALASMGAARLVGDEEEPDAPGERELVESDLSRTL